MKKRLKLIGAFAGIMMAAATLLPTSSWAIPAMFDNFSAVNFNPAISNKTDYFTIYSSQTLPKHGWNTGFYIDYARHPLEVGRPLGTRVDGLIDDSIIGNFYATYGILDWFSVGMNIPVAFWWNHFNSTLVPLPFSDGSGTHDSHLELSDIRLELKFRILNNEDKLIGLAIVPFVYLPTGPSVIFLGDGEFRGGGKIVLDFNIHNRVKLALNV